MVQAVLFFRLGYPAAKWRNVYKGLTVLEFLLKRGGGQVPHTRTHPHCDPRALGTLHARVCDAYGSAVRFWLVQDSNTFSGAERH